MANAAAADGEGVEEATHFKRRAWDVRGDSLLLSQIRGLVEGVINEVVAERRGPTNTRDLNDKLSKKFLDVPGWTKDHPALPEFVGTASDKDPLGVKKIDFANGLIGVEVQFGHRAYIGHDLTKLEIAYRRQQIVAGVCITLTDDSWSVVFLKPKRATEDPPQAAPENSADQPVAEVTGPTSAPVASVEPPARGRSDSTVTLQADSKPITGRTTFEAMEAWIDQLQGARSVPIVLYGMRMSQVSVPLEDQPEPEARS